MNYVLYPITHYHLLTCIVLREVLDSDCIAIIIDQKIFGNELLTELQASGRWERIFFVEKYGGAISANRTVKANSSWIETIKNSKIIYFSPGNNVCNKIIEALKEVNDVAMGEDGIAPYYFQDLVIDWISKEGGSGLIARLKKFLKYIIITEAIFDADAISEVVLTMPSLLSKSVDRSRVTLLNIPQYIKEKAISEFSTYFDASCFLLNSSIKWIYFQSNILSTEARIIEEGLVLKIIGGRSDERLLYKPRSDGTDSRVGSTLEVCNPIIIKNIERIPWEVFYFWNRAYLRDATFLMGNVSTTIFSTSHFFEENHNTVILGDIFPERLLELCDRLVISKSNVKISSFK